MRYHRLAYPAALLALACCLPEALAINGTELDDFNSSDRSNWFWPAADEQPAVLADGGPAGLGDGYLEVFSLGGFGANSRMAVINRDQWSGDYAAAGVVGVRLDLLADPSVDLHMRLSLSDQTFQNANRYSSATPYLLEAGSGWNEGVEFMLDSASLTQVSGTSSLEDLLSSVAELRLISSEQPHFKGDQVTATVGMDNVEAMTGAAELLGDYSNDGSVDAADYVVWANHVGEASLPNSGGLSGPVGEDHLQLWKDNYGSGDLAVALPEPSCICLFSPALLTHFTRRHRRCG